MVGAAALTSVVSGEDMAVAFIRTIPLIGVPPIYEANMPEEMIPLLEWAIRDAALSIFPLFLALIPLRLPGRSEALPCILPKVTLALAALIAAPVWLTETIADLAIPELRSGSMSLLGLRMTLLALSILPMAATPLPLLRIMWDPLPIPMAIQAASPSVLWEVEWEVVLLAVENEAGVTEGAVASDRQKL